MKTTVEDATPAHLSLVAPVDPALLAVLVDGDMAPLRKSQPEAFHPAVAAQHPGRDIPTSVGTRAEVLLELAGIKAAMRTWYQKQPDEVIREASGYSARLTELWTELKLMEIYDRTYLQIRTMQVTPVIEEIDRQFEFAKSRIAMMRQDLDMVTRGGGGI